jgi:hypothetical protein
MRSGVLPPNDGWTVSGSRSLFNMSEISLNGGEISILKTIGLSGGMMAGAQLADRMDEMEGAEFLDTLAGLIAMDYVVSNKVNIRTMDAVKSASFRVNPAFARELKEAVYPSRQKADSGRRRRRS